jgi:nicotinate-nucleotide adenylyltransferase
MDKRAGMGKRVGLFGGTFNPIHLGHLRGAEEIREAFDLEEVIFIPSSIPPHKVSEGVIEAKYRLEMVRLAISENPYFSLSDIELKRPGKSYSIDTIQYFRETYPWTLYFILGSDAFVEIETWKQYQTLFTLCDFIVMVRPGVQGNSLTSRLPSSLRTHFHPEGKEGRWIHSSGHCLFFKEITFLDISSTKIREAIAHGKSVKYLLPPAVERYIKECELYRKIRGEV